MKEIIALQEYTDKYVSLYEGEIRNISDKIADQLVEKGIVAIHNESSSGSSGGGSNSSTGFKITMTYDETTEQFSLDKTYNEIVEAINNGIMPIAVLNTPENEQTEETNIGFVIQYFYNYMNDFDDNKIYGIKIQIMSMSDINFISNTPNGILMTPKSQETITT